MGNAKGINVLMTMYNLIERSNNYSKTENLQQYFRNEPTVNGVMLWLSLMNLILLNLLTLKQK